MKRWIGVGLVVVAAILVVVFRPARIAMRGSQARTATSPISGTHNTKLLLVADLAEAEESCGCGEIIRTVRRAAKRGIAVREVSPGADPDVERRYRVTVAPTLLLLDDQGREVQRYEGESPAVVDSIRTGIDRMAPAGS